MKKIFIISFIFLSVLSFAQLKKGNLLLGGSIGVSSSNSDQDYTAGGNNENKNFSVGVSPNVGLFISDQSVIGLGLGYDYSKNEYGNSAGSQNKNRNSSLSIAPFYRYYFPMGEKIALYFQARGGIYFGTGKQSNTYYDPNLTPVITNTKSSTSSQSIGIHPGVVFFISPKWSIEATILSLNYQRTKEKADSYVNKRDSFYLQYSSIGFGFNWYLSK